MKIGIMSDSHDNLNAIKEAVAFFNREKVGLVLHAGDFVAPFTLDILAQLNCRYIGVLGNNDGEKIGLVQKSKNRIHTGPYAFKFAGKRIIIMHVLNKQAIKGSADLVVFGHTHKVFSVNQENTLFFNPGECGGWLYGKATVAIMDLNTLEYTIKQLNITK